MPTIERERTPALVIPAWNPAGDLSAEKLDCEHSDLFGQIETLKMAAKEGLPQAVCQEIISRLIMSLVTHFMEEEGVMEEAWYPWIEEHREAHRAIQRLLDHLLSESMERPNIITMDLADHVSAWMRNHLCTMDRRLMDYLRDIAPAC